MEEENKHKAVEIDPKDAAAWLNTNWPGDKECPICKKNTWSIGNTIQEVRQYYGGGLVLGGPIYPVFLVTCTVCGYTLFFNAIVAGLMKPEENEEEPTEESESDSEPSKEIEKCETEDKGGGGGQ